jgi:sugar-specific transcriptional regulator TrmB
MSQQEGIDALRTLGLSNYEAQVFAALQRLDSGTAQEVSDLSEVPRSQVYGAADDLAERGLVEVVEGAPKAYRSVKLSTAREILSRRLEEETSRAFNSLESIRKREFDHRDEQGISTLRGRQPIADRIVTLVQSATGTIVYVSPSTEGTTPHIADALRDAATNEIDVTVVTADEPLDSFFADSQVNVFVMSQDNPADFAGRALMIDERTVLLAAETDDSPIEEEALWTGNSSIGRILSTFMRSGMEFGRKRESE